MLVSLAVVMAFEFPGPWRAAGLVPVCLALYLTPWSLRRARRSGDQDQTTIGCSRSEMLQMPYAGALWCLNTDGAAIAASIDVVICRCLIRVARMAN